MPEYVSAADFEELRAAIQHVLAPLSLREIKDVRLKGVRRQSLALSFSADWQPFLNRTVGYHDRIAPPRLYIGPVPRVVQVAEAWLRAVRRQRPGGRVFIDENGVRDYRERSLGAWEWHAGEPAWKLVDLRASIESEKAWEVRLAAIGPAVDALRAERAGDCRRAEQLWLESDQQLANHGDLEEGQQLVRMVARHVAAQGGVEAERPLTDADLRLIRECVKQLFEPPPDSTEN